MRFTLVPSPLLGPATWRTTAQALWGLGHEVDVATHDAVPGDPGVLVPHSNAGYWVAGKAPTVFVDAALPAAGVTETVLAPPVLLDFLRGLAVPDGVLPPWTQWWPDTDSLFPDAQTRAAVESEQPRLPLTFFEQRVPVPAGWADGPCAYLAFGPTYAEEQAFARDRGWPTTVLDGHHLHMLHDPGRVAEEIVRLAASLRS